MFELFALNCNLDNNKHSSETMTMFSLPMWFDATLPAPIAMIHWTFNRIERLAASLSAAEISAILTLEMGGRKK